MRASPTLAGYSVLSGDCERSIRSARTSVRHNDRSRCWLRALYWMWESLGIRAVRIRENAGSNPAIQTMPSLLRGWK